MAEFQTEGVMDYKEFRQNCITARDTKGVLLCGSLFELPLKYFLINPTDTDRIFYMNDVCAIPSQRKPPKNFKGTVLNIESAGHRPGFVKLMRRDDNSDFQRPVDVSRGDIDGPARLVPQEIRLPFIITAVLYFVRRRSKTSGLDTPSTDESYSVYCPYWPKEVEEWLTRERKIWPDETLIARIKKGGCHFVLKPHHSNPDDKTEWRFSFSKAELILIHSWTPVQKHVYHLLRLAKNKVIDDCGGKENTVLRTYHFKTVMLWACEEKPPEFWNENNTGSCVRELLNEMGDWLRARKCPNYFIPEMNMLDALKIESNEFKTDQNIETLIACAKDDHLDSSSTLITTLQQSIVGFGLPNAIYELVFVSMSKLLFPLHEKLNASLRDKLYKCECFLPDIKQLFNALVANVKLLSIDNVCDRRASKDYHAILSGYETAMNASTDESRRILTLSSAQFFNSLFDVLHQIATWPLLLHSAHDDTILDNGCKLFNSMEDIGFPILPQEHLNESTRRSFSLRRTLIEKMFLYLVKKADSQFAKLMPSPMYLMSTAYLANFYYTTTNDYARVLRLSKEVHEANSQIRKVFENFIYFTPNLPMIISTDFAALFDEHMRTVIGFTLLYKAASFTCPSTSDTASKVVFPLSPIRFLRYVEFLSTLKTDKNFPKVFAYTPDCYDYVNYGTRNTVCFSEAFLAAAMRCNGIKVIRISSKNVDPNVSFGEVLGRILCRIENSDKYESQELIQMLNSLDSENRELLVMLNSPDKTCAHGCKFQLEILQFGFMMAELEASDLILYFRFKSTEDVKRMKRNLKSGKAKTLVEKDFNKLLSRVKTLISVSLKWFPGDYDRCINGFNHN